MSFIDEPKHKILPKNLKLNKKKYVPIFIKKTLIHFIFVYF